MPNNFTVIGLCGRDQERLESMDVECGIDFDSLTGVNLCELVSRRPEVFDYIFTSMPRCRYRHRESGEWARSPDDSPQVEVDPLWERVILTSSEILELQREYGAADWFDWNLEYWGTKWGTYSTKVHTLGGDGSPILIEFQSAWNPPSPEMMRKIDNFLCEKYYLKDIRWLGHQPFNNTPCDIEIAPLAISNLNLNHD